MKDDVELVAAAFMQDEQMARQVSNLLTSGVISEDAAREQFRLIKAGHLRSQPCLLPHYVQPICTRPHSPIFPTYPYWSPTVWGNTSSVTVTKANEVYTLASVSG